MHTVSQVRRAIESINGCFRDFPPEERREGQETAVPIWREIQDGQTVSYAPDGDSDDQDLPEYHEAEPVFEFPPEEELENSIHKISQDKDSEILATRLLDNGIDGYGWYVSFHNRGIQWGIYIPTSGIISLGRHLGKCLNCDAQILMHLSFRIIHQHELFHFATDYMAAQWELLYGRACYVPARSLKDARFGHNLREEQCANAYVLRMMSRSRKRYRPKGTKACILKLMAQQPPGYRCAQDIERKDRFMSAIERLSLDYIDKAGITPFKHSLVDVAGFYGLTPVIPWTFCPIHIIHDEKRHGLSRLGIELFPYVREIRESECFRKQLEELPEAIRRTWVNKQRILASTTSATGLDFKPWPKAGQKVYSIRVNDNYRAHLRYEPQDRTWEALQIGNHKVMGHD